VWNCCLMILNHDCVANDSLLLVSGLQSSFQGNTVNISSSRMRVMNHSWSARKQCLHLQSAAGISRHSVLSEDKIQQCGTSSESHCKDSDSVCKSPFPSAGTTDTVSISAVQSG